MVRKRVEKESRGREPSAMEYIGEISLSLSFNLICRKMLEFASKIMGYKNCSVLLIDEKSNEIYVKDFVGFGRKYKDFRIAVDSPKGLIPYTVRRKKTFYCPHVTKEKRYVIFSEKMKSELVVPLKVKDKAFGVINVESEKKDGFPVQDIKLFEMLASAASVAMENSRLFENLSSLKSFNENIVRSMEEGILLEDKNGIIKFINPGAAEMLGYSSYELVGKHWSFIIPQDYLEKVELESKKRPRGMRSRYEASVLTKEGKKIPIIISARPLFEGKKFVGTLSVFTDITDMLKAEQEMRRLKEFNENILRSTPIGIFTTDNKGNVTSANVAMLEILGSPSEEETKKFNVLELPTIRAIGWDATFRKVLLEGESIDEEAVYTSYWGKKSNVHLKCIPLYEESKIAGLIGIAEDVTEHKKAEETLNNQYSVLKGIIESTDALIFSIDQDYRYTSFNSAHAAVMKAIYGVNIEIGKNLLEYMSVKEDRATAKNNIDRALAGEHLTEESYSGEESLSRLYFEVSHNPIRDERGKVIGVTVYAKDITERKKAEQALQESEKRYRALYRDNPSMFFTLDSEGKVISVNEFGANQLGYTIAELEGQSVLKVFHKEDHLAVTEQLKNCLQNPWQMHQWEFRKVRKDGSILWVEEHARAVVDSEGVLNVFVVCQDITERKKAEENLSAIYSFSQDMSLSRNFSEIASIVFDCAKRILSFDNSVIMLVDDSRNELVIAARKGFEHDIGNHKFPLNSEKGTCVWVVNNGKPRVVPDVSKDERYLPGLEGAASELAVPMKVKDKVIGVLDIESRKLDAFTERDVTFLSILANSAAAALQNIKLLEKEHENASNMQKILSEKSALLVQISKLFEVSNTTAKLMNLQETLDTIVNAIKDSGTWKSALISLKDEKGYFHRRAFAGLTEEEKKKLYENPISPEIMKVIFDERMRISRSYYHPHGGPTMRALNAIAIPSRMSPEECVDWHPEDLLIIPFYDKEGNILGYLNVDEPTDGRRPTEESLKILETFANNASVAIENARLYTQAQKELEERKRAEEALKRRARELAALYETTLEINAQPNLTTLLHAIVERAADLVGAPMGGLYLVKPDGQTLELVVSHNMPQDFTGTILGLGEGLSGRIAQTGEPFIIEDYSHWEDRSHAFDAAMFGRVLGVPLKLGNRVIGVLNINDDIRTGTFTDEETRLVNLFADQAAIAIENARLYRDIRETRDHLRNIVESSAEAIIAADNEGNMLTFNRGAEIMFGYEASEMIGKNVLDYYPAARQVMKEIRKSKEKRIIDYETEAIGKGDEIIPISISATLLYDDKGTPIGSLGVFRDLREKKKMEEKFSVIYDISREISITMDLDKIFEKVSEACQKILNFKIMAIALVDEEREELYIRKHIGYPEGRKEEIQSMKGSLKEERGIVLAAVRDGKSIIIPDISKDPRYIQIDSRIKSELAVPLKVGEKAIGVLNVESERLDAFSEDDKRLLETLASQTAIAIENARLLEKEKESARRNESLLVQISKLFEVSNTVTKLTSLQETMDTIVNAIRDSGTWRVAVIALKDEKGYLWRSAFAGVTEEEKRILSESPFSPEIQKILFDESARISHSYYHIHGGPTMRALDAVLLPSSMSLDECVDWNPDDLLVIPFSDKAGSLLGYLCVDEPTDGRRPTEETIKILETFANNASVAIEDARLHERERESAKKTESLLVQISKLFEVSNTTTKLTSLQETLDTIVNAIKDSGAWRKAVIGLRDEKGNLRRCAFAGLTEEEKRKLSENPIVPEIQNVIFDERMRISRSYYHPHRGPTVKVLDTIAIPSTMSLEECVDWHPDDIIYIPFYDKAGSILGYLNVDEPTDGRRPTEESIKIIEIFANNASVAIENARLFEEEKERTAQLVMINDLSKKMTSTLNIKEIAGIVVEDIQKMFSFYSVELYVKEEERLLLAACSGAGVGTLEVGKFQALGKGMIGWTAKYGKTLLANDVTKEEKFIKNVLEDTKSELCIPLRIQTEVVGVLNIESDRLNAFNEEDVYVLETLSGQIASSIKNARLYGEIRDFSRMLQTKVEEKSARTETLLETSYALRQTTSWEVGLKTIVEGIIKGLKIESATILLVNERTNTLDYKTGFGIFSEREDIRLPLTDTRPVAVKCVREKKSINIKDASTDPRVEMQVGIEVPSFAWVPILSQSEALGAICVANPESKALLSDEDIEMVSLYANAAALFLEKTRYLVSPATEKKLPTQLKYKLSPMEGYLIFEEKADKAFDIFCDLVTHGIQGFCVSRMPPDLIRKKYKLEKTPIVWLSHASIKESIDPQDLGKMNHIITEFLHKAEDAVVLLEGLEYLITENDFPHVIKALHALSDAIVLANARLLLPFNPKTISEKELSILEREFSPFK